MARGICYLTVVLLLVAMLAACASPGTAIPETTVLMWPPAPEPARIAWIKSFSRPEDLGIRRTFLQRVKDLLFGASEAKLVRPMAVVVSGQLIFVADPGVRGVHRFDTGNGEYRLIVAADGSPLPSPVGLTRCGDEVLVADSSRAQLFSLPRAEGEARLLVTDSSLQQPTGLACDAARGRLFVSDTAAHQIRIFQRNGERLVMEKSFGRRGAADGEFNFPTYLWWSSAGHLQVSDALNFRIQTFDGEGRFQGRFGRLGDGSGDAARQKGVAVDSQGHVYVVDSLFHAFQIFDEKGDFLLAVGARGGGAGEFWLPTGIFIEGDTVYVADSYNSRIQMFRYLGAAP